MTRPMEEWAEDMATLTDGRWEIEIHFGAVLAKPADNLEGIKEGLFEAGAILAFYHPGKTPLRTVFDLPYVTPERGEDIMRMSLALMEHPALKAQLEEWNAVEVLKLLVLQYQVVGNKRVAKVEDFNGLRIRASQKQAGPISKYGAVPVMAAGSEIYPGLDAGVFDAVAFPLGTMKDFKLAEISKYLTLGANLGTAYQFVAGSKTAWEALPKEWQELSSWYMKRKAMEFAALRELSAHRFLKELQDEGRIEIIQFPPEDEAKLREAAMETRENWVKEMEEKGLPGREILDFALAKKKELTGA